MVLWAAAAEAERSPACQSIAWQSMETSTAPRRADARRNRERLLAAAEQVVARDGAGASLEEIARLAGVGSATLHRHFSSRQAMLQELFHHRMDTLCLHATELAASDEAGTALITWLREVGQYIASTRGLAASMRADSGADDANVNGCYTMTASAGAVLLQRAQAAGEVRDDVTIDDLLSLVNAISQASEHDPDAPATVDRLLMLAVGGVRITAPRRRPRR